MTEILKDVSTYLEDMTEHNKEGLSHFLFYTNDGSDLNSWKQGTLAPVFGTEEIIPVDKSNHIASDEELCSWAKHDYESKNGVTGTNASLLVKEDGTYEITITDKESKVLDTYTIDPKTGVGVDAENAEVNLPQTGNNSAAGMLAVMGALAMIGFGFCS
ncbi:MAG: LPXTG cell wall anchor domain-containing protein [Oscillospiraceae bacterium]|nr:LPXTG cell wall anchor domain-containing protein [Oscillospiraceae bacterium]